MKRVKMLWLLFGLLAALSPGVGWARGWHGGGGDYGGYHGGHYYGHGGAAIGFYFGPGFAWPYYPWPYGPYPYSAYPPAVVTVPASPPVYVERNLGQSAPSAEGSYWYYCRDRHGYYPYVKQCPGGWEPVPPQPPR